jgi:glycosidase
MNFRFEPVRWSLNTNVYEINLRQYTPEGTFQAFAKELPRLKDMGVETLWFMPIQPIGEKKRLGSLGSYYSISNYTDTNPEFGTIRDFRMLVKKAHDLKLRVLIDWVANHTSWDHSWTISHPEFYKRNAQNEFYDNNNWSDVIDLNYYDYAMRKAMIACMEFWVNECNIDGFRCDMAHLVPLDFWRQARQHLDKVKPLFWLAETEHVNYQYVFDCSYAWNWMHLTESFIQQKLNMNDLKSALAEYQRKKLPQTNYLFFTSNHDENSWNGTEYEKYREGALPLAVLTCTWNGIPLIYSGQELPNNKRLKFFDKDPIEWNQKPALHQFYKTLLDLRSSFGEESTTALILNTDAESRVLAFLKISRLKQILVVLNLGANQQKVQFSDAAVSGRYREVFTAKNYEAPSINNIMMEPWSYLVFEKI